jgi:hypothetical protein
MNDKELLEMAAKAAGYRTKANCFYVDCDDNFNGIAILPDRGKKYRWNPLQDDGEALRLAINVGIEVGAIGSPNQVFCEARCDEVKIVQRIGDDKYAAVRLAIVRCAAEIGKNIP